MHVFEPGEKHTASPTRKGTTGFPTKKNKVKKRHRILLLPATLVRYALKSCMSLGKGTTRICASGENETNSPPTIRVGQTTRSGMPGRVTAIAISIVDRYHKSAKFLAAGLAETADYPFLAENGIVTPKTFAYLLPTLYLSIRKSLAEIARIVTTVNREESCTPTPRNSRARETVPSDGNPSRWERRR